MRTRKRQRPARTISCELCKTKFIGKKTNIYKGSKKTAVSMMLCPDCVHKMKNQDPKMKSFKS